MKVSVSGEGGEGFIDIDIEECDYVDEFHNSIRSLRGMVHKNGFRSKNIASDVLYGEYGYDVLKSLCFNRIHKEVRTVLNDGELKDVKCFSPLLYSSTFPVDGHVVDFRKLGSYRFRFIYGVIPDVDIDVFIKDMSSISVERRRCKFISDKVVLDMSNAIKFHSGVKKHKKVSGQGDIVCLKNEGNVYMFLADGCTVDGNPICLTGKSLGDTVVITANDWGSVTTPSEQKYFDVDIDYISSRLKEGDNTFEVSDILSFTPPVFHYDYIKRFFLDRDIFDKCESKWIYYDHDAIIDLVIGSELEREIKNSSSEHNERIFDEKIKILSLVNVNDILEKALRYDIKQKVISRLDVEMPMGYIRHQLHSRIASNGAEGGVYIEMFVNSLKWECFRSACIKKFGIRVSDEEMKAFGAFYKFVEDNDWYKTISRKLDAKYVPGVQDSYGDHESMVADRKVIDILDGVISIKDRDIAYDEFLSDFYR